MLTSLQNPLVKQIRKLHQAKGRREQQLFLLEGTHLVEEACAVEYPLETICCTPDWVNRYPQLWEQVQQRSQRVELVSDPVIAAIATTTTPDGVVATAPRRLIPPNSTEGQTQLEIALETIQDPGNLGTLIRTAAAASCDRLWISSDSVDLDHPKVLRASAGQWFRLPMAVCSDLQDLVEEKRSQGMQIVATLPRAELTYWELDWTQPTFMLLGNEGAGLSSELADLADQFVKIPLAQGVESLNVAIATALLLYEAQRQRCQGKP